MPPRISRELMHASAQAAMEPIPTAQPSVEARPWAGTLKFAFRFAFCYLMLYIFPFPLETFEWDKLGAWYGQMWQKIVPWVSNHILHLSITNFTNGSGDTTFDYLKMVCLLLAAAVGTLIWSALDRRRAHYTRLY